MNKNDYWTNRRTIRAYTAQPVSPEKLDDMLQKAAHAPTTGNMQLYSVIVSTSAEEKARLAPAHFNQPQVESAAAVLTFCADFHRFSRWCEERNADPCYDNLQSFMAAVIDTVCFAQQFNTIAEQEGFGVCMLGTTTYNAPQIAEALNLPELVVPVITLTVGYPANEGVEVGRLPLDAYRHFGSYPCCTREAIDAMYAEKESRADSRQFVAENGKTTLAQVFTDVRYPRANNEAFSEIFLGFLRNARFLKRFIQQ